ncbi:MAG: Ig-like domain-containing protein [Oscillospiraceae bacterium]|nr:Ig-like domain-containing protein [Oscillospiraceae bacterium]
MKLLKKMSAILFAMLIVLGVSDLGIVVAESLPATTSVAISTSTLTVGAGETRRVKSSVTPKKAAAVKWTSDKKSIATVDNNGNITGKKAGTAKITAKSGKMSAAVTVTVKAAPKKVTLPKTMRLSVGQKKTPKASVDKNARKKLTWKSSDPKIAAVDKKTGKITPLKTGTVTIRATSYNKIKSNKMTLTVTARPAPKKITGKKLTLGVKQTGKAKAQLTFSPSYASTSVTFVSTNEKIATVDKKGVITPRKKGTVTIKAISAKNKTVVGKFKLTVLAAPKSIKFTNKKTTPENRLVLGMGEKLNLNIDISGLTAKQEKTNAGKRTYKVGNSKVVKVDKKTGKAAIVGVGKTTVTVTTWNKKSAKLHIQVKPAPTSFSFEHSNITITAGQKFTNPMTVAPLNAHSSWVYSTDNAAVATVNAAKGEFQGQAAGTTTIRLRAYNGKSASYKVTVIPNANGGTGTPPAATVNNTKNFTQAAELLNNATKSVNDNLAGYKFAGTTTSKGSVSVAKNLSLWQSVAVGSALTIIKATPEYKQLEKGETFRDSRTVPKGKPSDALPSSTLRATDISAMAVKNIGANKEYTLLIKNATNLNSASPINRFSPEKWDTESVQEMIGEGLQKGANVGVRVRNTSVVMELNPQGRLVKLQYNYTIDMDMSMDDELPISLVLTNTIRHNYTDFVY